MVSFSGLRSRAGKMSWACGSQILAAGERADCLKQDLQDFGGIFGIAGERLMVGRRVFFAAGERAGCGGEIIGDAPYVHKPSSLLAPMAI